MNSLIQTIILCIFSILAVSCNPSDTQPNTQHTERKEQIVGSEVEQVTLTNAIVSNKICDFGTVSNDTLLLAKYYMKNTGSDTLRIEYVNPDCTCTGYTLDKEIIAQGDSACIELKLDTHHKVGKQKIYTTVCANTETKFYALIMKCDVADEL